MENHTHNDFTYRLMYKTSFLRTLIQSPALKNFQQILNLKPRHYRLRGVGHV
jgi:hypothetical protein